MGSTFWWVLSSGYCCKVLNLHSSHIQIHDYIGIKVKSKFYINHIYLSKSVFWDFCVFWSKNHPPEFHLPGVATNHWQHHSLSRTFKAPNLKNRFLSEEIDLPSKWRASKIGASGQLSPGGVVRIFYAKCAKEAIYFQVAIRLDSVILRVYNIASWFLNI